MYYNPMPTRDELRKLNPKVYRIAAELIDSKQETFTCYAVPRATARVEGNYEFSGRLGLRDSEYAHKIAWKNVFGPDGANYDKHPFWDMVSDHYTTQKGYRNNRVIALLTMAEIVASARRGR